MTLPAGTKLGPYEVLSPIGAGGMGEVYKARDERLKRDVAIKVLPATYSQDPDRLRRFEQEAQAAGGLNHPNITAVYDLGSLEGSPYIVTELLEGETLRARLSGGAIAVRKATDYAVQIAKGLAAAHEKGIVHRDLKPENLFLTNDGRVKILDFGLAKLTQVEASSGPQTNLPTATGTEPGVVMGTLGYMSPEQVKGKPADQRSDIFAFGAILYEMLSGQRAFHRDSAAETMSAILREEPPDLSATNKSVQPGLERIVRHCLEKNPEERFYSARDVAFDLEALSGLSAPQTGPAAVREVAKRPSWLAVAAAVVATALVCGAIAMVAVRRAGDRPPPSFRQLTFRRGQIFGARFAPDGQTVMYSGAWDGKPMEVFVGRPESPESRPFGLAGAEVLSISKTGDMAVSLNRQYAASFRRSGTLAQLSVAGGAAPREILKEVEWADWAPDGKTLVIARGVPKGMRIEFPAGKVLYETSGWVSHLRISPDGSRIAFDDHPAPNDDGGSIAVVDLAGKRTIWSKPFATAQGLAWSPDGSEVWFTSAEIGGNRALYSSRDGRVRLRARVPGNLTLQDVSRDGRMLVTRDTQRTEILALPPGETKERDLTWLDWSVPATISRDGKTILFFESGEGGGAGYSVYIRKTDGSPAVRLGEGSAQDLSPDGEWALAIVHSASDPQLAAYPTGAGEPRLYSKDGIAVFGAGFSPDGKQIFFTGNEAGHGPRVYVRGFTEGKPRALTPEGYVGYLIAPDGKAGVVRGPDRKYYIYPFGGGEPTAVPGYEIGDGMDQYSADGRFLYIHRTGEVPINVQRLELATGRRGPWRTLMPSDGAGVSALTPVITPDGSGYALSYVRTLSDLYLVEGLK
ncbi:MAG TPA: protein kinase [Thermoanaerobaculia bacterium]|nr:protein kinase [Thermoanaerobaculia bacterium]